MATAQDQTMFAPDDSDSYIVRRLTPLEAERLMGFPDGHTDLAGLDPEQIWVRMPQWQQADESGRKDIERKVRKWCDETPDGARYKACGNSMAVPVMMLLGTRIQKVNEILESEPEPQQRLL